MHDVYDFAKLQTECGNIANIGIESACRRYFLRLTKNFLILGSSSMQSGSGVD